MKITGFGLARAMDDASVTQSGAVPWEKPVAELTAANRTATLPAGDYQILVLGIPANKRLIWLKSDYPYGDVFGGDGLQFNKKSVMEMVKVVPGWELMEKLKVVPG